MDLDQEKIKKRIAEINKSLSEIRRILTIPKGEFEKEGAYMSAIKYHLLEAIEAAGNICVHISAKKYNESVSAFGECFEKLVDNASLDRELADKLRKMVQFRNILIHQYWKIDDKKVLQYCQKDLGDIEEFVEFIKKEIGELRA